MKKTCIQTGSRVFARCCCLVGFTLFLASNSIAGPVSKDHAGPIYKWLEERNIDDIVVDLNVRLPTVNQLIDEDNDAVLWGTAIYHDSISDESGSQARPTILIVTPYRREFLSIVYLPLLLHDYNIFVVDQRGTGSSEDIWTFLDPIEQYDTAFVIDEWLPKQPWCNGAIGMLGPSYMGISQFLASGLVQSEFNPQTGRIEPKHLKALFPLVPLSDAFKDIAMQGGNMGLEFITLFMSIVDMLSILPPLLFVGEETLFDLDDIQRALDTWKEHAQQLTVPLDWMLDPANIVQNPFYQTKSPMIYWPEKPTSLWDFTPDYPSEVGGNSIPDGLPVFTTAAWYGIFTRGSLNNYEYGLQDHDVADKAMVIGPWYHMDGSFGIGVKSLFSLETAARWFDWKIRGVDDPFMVEYPVVLYVLGEDRWRAEKSWPLPESRVDRKSYYLSKRQARPIVGDWFSYVNEDNNYRLVEEPSDDDYYSRFLWWKRDRDNPVLLHDPTDLHGLVSRSSTRFGIGLPAAVSQISKNVLGIDIDSKMPWEDERKDNVGVLTFSTDPLSQDVEIAGPLLLSFWAETTFTAPLTQRSIDVVMDGMKEKIQFKGGENALLNMMDRKDVQWVIGLEDVYPNGRAKNLTSGWLSAWRRPYDPSDPSRLDPNYTPFDPFYDHPDKYPSPIDEETLYPYVIEIWPTDNVFKKGHRIRVSISASDFPHLLPLVRPSENTIVIDEDHPARLDFDAVNRADEGITWKWIDDVSDYLVQHSH